MLKSNQVTQVAFPQTALITSIFNRFFMLEVARHGKSVPTKFTS